ncbi:MAG TPA: 30S ribosomal protein S2 [Candidatus Paceibacterota bacterium]|nr:30S ribosomal protein S2 [Candidatus Paceibacterota bacterium]
MSPETNIETLFEAGAHFGYARARRHPTATPYLFGTKDRTDIFNLDETGARIEAAIAFVQQLSGSGKQMLFVGGKHEVMSTVKMNAERIGQPYVAGRWIGGTLTNFKNIRKRIDLLEKSMGERERGELEKYTKKERLLIDRQIDELLGRFGGLVKMNELPGALFVVDTRHEDTAVREANQLGIPVIGLSSSDGDFSLIQYPIPANDTSVKSVSLITSLIAKAYEEGKKSNVLDSKHETQIRNTKF